MVFSHPQCQQAQIHVFALASSSITCCLNERGSTRALKAATSLEWGRCSRGSRASDLAMGSEGFGPVLEACGGGGVCCCVGTGVLTGSLGSCNCGRRWKSTRWRAASSASPAILERARGLTAEDWARCSTRSRSLSARRARAAARLAVFGRPRRYSSLTMAAKATSPPRTTPCWQARTLSLRVPLVSFRISFGFAVPAAILDSISFRIRSSNSWAVKQSTTAFATALMTPATVPAEINPSSMARDRSAIGRPRSRSNASNVAGAATRSALWSNCALTTSSRIRFFVLTVTHPTDRLSLEAL